MVRVWDLMQLHAAMAAGNGNNSPKKKKKQQGGGGNGGGGGATTGDRACRRARARGGGSCVLCAASPAPVVYPVRGVMTYPDDLSGQTDYSRGGGNKQIQNSVSHNSTGSAAASRSVRNDAARQDPVVS